jgi:MFS family permease
VAHRQRPSIRLLAVLGTAFGVSMTGVALSPTIIWAIVLMVPTGAFSIAFVSSANALMQLNSAEEMRGRTMSLYGTAFLGTTPVGAEIVGAVIAGSSPRIGILVGSVLTLATGIGLAATVHVVKTRRAAAGDAASTLPT